MLIAVPTGIKIFNWLFTMWGGSIKFTTANLYAIGFIPTFVMGGVTGVMLAAAPADYQYHDSYFVVAHFHYVIVGGLVLGIFAGLHYWWPKMFGRILNETLGKITFWTFYIGFHLTFFLQHFLGLLGMQRRIWQYFDGMGYNNMNFISTIGAFLMGVGTILFLINVALSFKQPRGCANDPWEDGRTLEWTIPSPAPEYNFAQTPLVRGYDAWWHEKMEGNSAMTPVEPIGPIHMPNSSILPFVMGFGLFVTGFGFMYSADWGSLGFITVGHAVGIIGLLITFSCMGLRSLIDDHGFHIEKDEILKDQGVKS